jgi:hypothetical protein
VHGLQSEGRRFENRAGDWRSGHAIEIAREDSNQPFPAGGNLTEVVSAGRNWIFARRGLNPLRAKAEFLMKKCFGSPRAFAFSELIFVALISLCHASGQSCQTSAELADAARTGMSSAAQRYFEMAARNDLASLRQNSIPSLAADFSAVEGRLKDHQQDLGGAQATLKSTFLLDASGSAPLPHAEFYCGVFGKNGQTATSAVFYLDNLPPGKYAVVLYDVNSRTGKAALSEILVQAGADWKLGDLYLNSGTVAGHDSDWFIARAREYKSKGQMHNAWLFYVEARNLISPLPFMSTLATDKLYEESANMQPTDLPANGKAADLSAGASTYKLTAVFPAAVSGDLDLIVKYQSANVSNSNLAYQDNLAVMKAMVAKYPELKDAFAAVVARAVDSTGHDYGTLLAMKDIK